MNVGAEDRDPLTGAVLGAAFEVANQLGHGFLEGVYQKALFRELGLRGIRTDREVPFRIVYKGEEIVTYVADMIVERSLIIELKCAATLADVHVSQCLNYLSASGLKTALLINFGKPRVEYRRIVR
jgi:GxxExxY protein